MRNFYFVCTYNASSPVVKQYLEDTCMIIEPGMLVDFKFRSKLFSTYQEAVNAAEWDFGFRLEVFFEDVEEHVEIPIQEMLVVNPAFAVNPDVARETAEKFPQHSGNWDPTCTAAIFFIEEDTPSEWLLKYEVYFADDGIEVAKNGELERYLNIEGDSEKLPTLLH